jgi:Uma2 family endonuclease
MRLGPRLAGLRMTPEELDRIPRRAWIGGNRYELVDGVLVVSPPPGNADVDPNEELGHLLRSYAETHLEGHSLDRTMPERTVPGTPNRRRCDRAVWADLGRVPDTEVDVPSIVIEFVSSRRRNALRDNERKRDESLAAGVRECWIIDRFRRLMTVYRPGPVGPTHEIVTESQTYATPLLPGFLLPLARLLAKADD